MSDIYSLKTAGEIHRPPRILIVGPPKTGKTQLAATFPKPLFVDTDMSDTILRSMGRSEIPVYAVPEYRKKDPISVKDRILAVPLQLRAKQGTFWNRLQELSYTPQTLVLDGLHSTAQYLVREVLMNPPDDAPTRRDDLLELRDYPLVYNQMAEILQHYRDCGLAFVATCSLATKEIGNGANKREIRQPGLPGRQLQEAIGHFFDDIYLLTRSNGVATLHTQQDSYYPFLGSRFNVPHPMVDPSYEKLAPYITQPPK